MPGPSRLPATSGDRAARTSRGTIGGTPESSTPHTPGLRHRVHAAAPRIHGYSVASPETSPAAAAVPAAPNDGGPEAAVVGPVRLAVTFAAQSILFALLGMLAWALLPFALGWIPTTVMTGSMEPRISAGDVLIARPIPTGTAALGHVLLVDDPDHAGRLRLHRYVQDTPDGKLILRGDANAANDSSPVAPEAVRGVAVLRVPYVGLPVVWFAEKNWANLAALFAGISALTVAAAAGSSAGRHDGGAPAAPVAGGAPRQSQHRHLPATRRAIRRRARTAARRATAVRTLLCLASLPVLVTPQLLLAAPAHAAFSAATPAQAGTFAAASSYDCLFRPAQDNPALFFGFNEASGPAAEDGSRTGNDGILSGAVRRTAGSCAGDSPALAFGSAAGMVSTRLLASAPETFSVSVWFKTTPGATSGGRLLGFGNTQTGTSTLTDRHLYLTDNGGVGFGVATRNGNSQQYKAAGLTTQTSYNDGRWHLATATSGPAGSVLYIDGVPKADNPRLVAERTYDGYWRVGYDSMDFDKNREWPGAAENTIFRGSIDNAAVYPTVLTQSQVGALYAAGR
ncbi:hypothetical protein E7Y32_08555 [Arthrobacter sp. UKPF54-2]|uniref:LamG-like jellyroll fold domain-containing protein n=1 Tax=Arthrobacter sp. UKPF54-2 TaxID=2600159 RepID=UPI0011B1227C|nr:LamG-like jellyroll fold domain-containing protein [Arthrobacter sp. UKPF54-2]QDY90252.1 hypothetical protein E7Y32_08555 [Arthrobacter sp. UKPF54-2]